MQELSDQRRRLFEDAVQRTRSILTPEQLTKYDDMMARRAEGRRGGPGGSGGSGGLGPGWAWRSMTRPAATEPAPGDGR